MPKGERLSIAIPYPRAQYHRSGVNKLLFDSTGEHLFSAGRDGSIRCWNVGKGKVFNASIVCLRMKK